MKKAFTLIELVFVIVILGIISLIGSDMYINIYTNYVSSKVINDLETETEVVLEQISARLSDRVRIATIGRVGATADIVLVDDSGLTNNHNVLEWIGQSIDSRDLPGNNFANTIGWSGSVDLFASSATNGLVSLGSNFARVGNAIDLATGDITYKNNVAIIFQDTLQDGAARHGGFGFNGIDGVADDTRKVMIANLTGVAGNTIPDANIRYPVSHISYTYQLAHTAYAIVPVEEDGETNLYLYYNYQPWNGEAYNDNGIDNTLLAKNISMFRFRGVNGTIDLKLCLRDTSGLIDGDFTVCKTKAVF